MSTPSLDDIPAGVPPPGVIPDFAHPATLRDVLIAFSAMFGSLMTIVVFIRFYVRLFVTHSIGWDDYTCGLAAILSWIQAGTMIYAASLGLGTHMWDLRLSTFTTSAFRWTFFQAIAGSAAIGFTKVSILLLLYRIFTVSRTFRKIIVASIVCMAVASIFYIVLSITEAVICIGHVANSTNPICGDANYPINVSVSIFGVVSDLWILVLPMRSIFSLQLRKRRRIGIIAIFGAGIVTCLVTLVRTILYIKFYNIADPLWTAAISTITLVVELNIGIMVACASTLGKFYRHIKPFVGSVYQSSLKKPPQLDFSMEKPKLPRFGNDSSSEMRLNDIEDNRNDADSSANNQKNEATYEVSEQIIRTDSFEIAYYESTGTLPSVHGAARPKS